MEKDFLLGPWRVEPARNRLVGSGEIRELEPKVMRLLSRLAAGDGAVVSRAELIADVWDGLHVEPTAVTRAVYQLRKTLRTRGDRCGYVETVRKTGYRLTAPVRPASKRRPQTPEPVFARAAALGLAVVLSLAAAAVLSGGGSRPGANPAALAGVPEESLAAALESGGRYAVVELPDPPPPPVIETPPRPPAPKAEKPRER